MKIDSRDLFVKCTDQSEWKQDPSWCLHYLRSLEIVEKSATFEAPRPALRARANPVSQHAWSENAYQFNNTFSMGAGAGRLFRHRH